MKNLLLISFILINLSLSAQCFWAKSIASSNITVSSIKASNGYVYTTGSFQYTVDFDPGPNTFNLTSQYAGSEDIFICKYDSLGNFVWAKRIGGNYSDGGLSITLDNQQNIVVTGVFTSTNPVDFDPGPGTFNLVALTGFSGRAGFVLKLDNNGDFINAVQIYTNGQAINGAVGWVNCTSVQIDVTGNIIVGGEFSNSIYNTNVQLIDFNPGTASALLDSDNGGFFVLKLTSDLNYVWAKNFCAGNLSFGIQPIADMIDGKPEIATDSDGKIYFTSDFSSTSDFDPSAIGVANLTPTGGSFVLKLSQSGNYNWVKQLEGTGGNSGAGIRDIKVDNNNDVILTGSFGGGVDFDPGTNSLTYTAIGTDGFVWKLNTFGALVFAKIFVSSDNFQRAQPFGLDLDNNSNIYLTGSYNQPGGSVDFDPGLGNFVFPNDMYQGSFLVKLNNNGDFTWAKNFSGASSATAIGRDISYSNNGVYSCGTFTSQIDFDPSTGVFNLTNPLQNTFRYYYLHKLDDSPSPIITAAASIVCQGQSTLLSTNIVAGSSYQWQKNGVNISGATTANYSATSAGSYAVIVTNSGGCSTASNAVALTLLNNTTPTFTQLSSCVGGQIILPTVSIENISGSWSPAVNNAVTTTYTFTPNAGQCASSQTMTVPVNSIVEPTFTQLSAICTGGTIDLPTISNENIAGYWSPNADNQATTTYYFIPNPGQCASYSTTMTVTVNTPITPTFPQISAICAGGTIALPAVSNQNIAGSWSPNVNNQSTTTYSFTPNAGQCANSQTMTVTVNSYPTINTQPTSTQVNIGNQAIFTTSATGGTYQWQVNSGSGFQNITNGGQYSGATTNTLTVSNTSMTNSTNQYRCVVTSNTCSTTSNAATLTVINNVGIDEANQLNNFEIYPNPTSNFVTVKFNNNLLGSNYQIIDNTGRIVLSGLLLNENQIIELNTLSAGIYSFSVLGELSKTMKLVKN
jgi:hypothetical protein